MRTAAERFEEKFITEPNSGCWIWIGTLTDKNYGHFWNGTKTVRAHRYSWEKVNGPIPEGLDPLHKCDFPPCINPDHLFLGTHQDNMRDRDAKGRTARGAAIGDPKRANKTHCKQGHPLSGANLIQGPHQRVCRTCHNRVRRQRRARRSAELTA